MPYTPPSHRSPAGSRPDSPPRSRDGSWVKPLPSSSPFCSSPGPRPALPRSSSSTSYLNRHRRSPSTPTTSFSCPSLDDSAKKVEGLSLKANGSIRQSPPPLNNLRIPTGAVMSPPDSGQNSSDDELLVMSDRGRRLDNLAELHAAIEHIEQGRERSPMRKVAETNMARNALTLDTNPKEAVTLQLPSARTRGPPLSKEARKISHSRSATDTNIYIPDINRSHSYSPPGSSSDSDLDDEAAARKPPMLRKKSGELVRPALRPPSARRRPSSMPGTPTFGKAVHFSNDLEHVRHFLQVDRPLAVSAETSPVETYESETEFPFQSNDAPRAAHEWEIRLANFPADMSGKPSAPINVERVFLSPDKKTLIGTAAVQNLAFNKAVVTRFTFDYWKTTSEVSAEFSHDVRRQNTNDGLDRFNFQIRLADQVNLESKTLFFCVRYNVAGQEFWDSNNGMNYQVDFTKKTVPAPAKAKQASGNEATRHINGLPRSRSPKQSPSNATFDDFGRGFDAHWDKELLPRTKSASSILSMDEGAAPIKFRNKASGNGAPAVLGRKAPQNQPQAFGHRYDFGASLTAAISAASTALGERSGLPQNAPSGGPAFVSNGNGSPQQDESKPAALTSEKPPAQSQSYNELLEKYCFFGSAKGSPLGTGSPNPAGGNAGSNLKPKFYLDGNESGSRSPSPARTPPSDEVNSGVGSGLVEPAAHVASPKITSRAASPSFGYPYHQSMTSSLPAPTAIHG